jgi:hypothetical protein
MMDYDQGIELARVFAERLGESTQQLSFAGVALIWVLNDNSLLSLPRHLWLAGVLLISAMVIDYFHSLVGAAWGGKVAWALAANRSGQYDASLLFKTLYVFLFAKSALLLPGYTLLLYGMFRSANPAKAPGVLAR